MLPPLVAGIVSQEKFRPDLDDEQACEHIEAIIENSSKSLMPQVAEAQHKIAQGAFFFTRECRSVGSPGAGLTRLPPARSVPVIGRAGDHNHPAVGRWRRRFVFVKINHAHGCVWGGSKSRMMLLSWMGP